MVSRNLIFFEKYGENGFKNEYAISEDKNIVVQLNEENCKVYSVKWILNGCRTVFYEIFLPQGYPESVSNDYYEYQFWDSIQAFCSTITGTLSTHSILKEVGVGDSSATALAATIVWILKDTSSMLSRITFAWWKGYMLDTDFKKWRFAADVINDVALGIEIMLDSTLLKPISSIMLCLSTCLKAIVGVAGGATRAAITQHQAIRGNSGDVSAKDGSQEMCVNLVASFVSLFILSNIENSKLLIWLLYVFITVMHLYSNYQAVHCLILTTLNMERFNLLIKHFLERKILEDTSRINKEESIVLGRGLTDKRLCDHQIFIGSSLTSALEETNEYTHIAHAIMRSPEKYILVSSKSAKRIYIILHKKASNQDVLKAYFHAVIFAIANSYIHQKNDVIPVSTYLELTQILSEIKCKSSYDSQSEVLEATDDFINNSWNTFFKDLHVKGWTTNKHQLLVNEWRSDWETQ